MTKPLDLTKPVQTRDGRKVRILCTDRVHPNFPVVGLISNDFETLETVFDFETLETVFYFTKEGKITNLDTLADLVNVPVHTSKWQNVYSDPTLKCARWSSPEKATENILSGQRTIGLLRWDYEDGNIINIEFIKEES